MQSRLPSVYAGLSRFWKMRKRYIVDAKDNLTKRKIGEFN